MTKQAYITKIRRYLIKQEAVKLKGNCCTKCGWSGNIAGFSFHHPDPSKKEFGLSNATTTNWEKYWNEAEKCELLCHNCHMILHSNNSDENFLKDVENYAGRDLISSNIPWKNQTHIPTVYHRNCKQCNVKFDTRIKSQKFCSIECKNESNRRCVRPTKDELQQLILKMPFLHIAKQYGVSDNAVRKWCKYYSIDYKKLQPRNSM